MITDLFSYESMLAKEWETAFRRGGAEKEMVRESSHFPDSAALRSSPLAVEKVGTIRNGVINFAPAGRLTNWCLVSSWLGPS